MEFFAIIILSVAQPTPHHELYVAGPYTEKACHAELGSVLKAMPGADLSCVSEDGLDRIAVQAKQNECTFVTAEDLGQGIKIAGFACK